MSRGSLVQHHLDRARALPSSTCRSSCWSSIPSTTRSWSRSGAASRPNGTSRCSHDRACSTPPGSRCASRVLSATVATVLGTLAALALVRHGRFRGRMLFSGMVYAPLVMPEVITGLSLLLLFVAVGSRPRLLDDHARPHHADHVLRRRRRAVAPGHLRPQPGGGRDGSRLPAAARPSWSSRCRSSCRRSSPAGCWPSRCRSTIWSSPASPPGRAPPRCR